MAKRKIDLIIPVYKNHQMTERCVESVVSCIDELGERDPRVILINDSPDDANVYTILSNFEKKYNFVKLITNKQNMGFVKSVNIGLEIAARDLRDVILINSDTQTFVDTMSKLVVAAYSDPQIGFACPRSNNAALCTLPHLPHPFGGRIPTPDQAYKHWLRLKDILPEVTFAPTSVGFYLYIKHEVLALFGGLRQDFGAGYEEENDLVMRANKVGFRAVMANKSFAYHYGSASFALSNLDLGDQRSRNLQKMVNLHPEFLPLIERYEASAHFRAEKLLGGLIPHASGKYMLAIDLLSIGCNHNGTTELAVQVIRRICEGWGVHIELTLLCSEAAFEFHRLGSFGAVTRRDLSDPGLHTIALRLGQPFDMHHVNVLETIAPIVVFGMLDVIALDCGYLSITHDLERLWAYVAENSNALFYISKYSKQTFEARFPIAKDLPKYTALLPTKIASYQSTPASVECEHILVLGNHFSHKAADYTARLLAAKFQMTKIVALGGESLRLGNLQIFKAGDLDEALVSRLFSRASAVVLPSFAEGFGFGFMHALAAGKPIIARRIQATEEILETFRTHSGIFLFENNEELYSHVSQAMLEVKSVVNDEGCAGWDDWVDGLMEVLLTQIGDQTIFHKLCKRIAAGDSLRAFVNASSAKYSSPPLHTRLLEKLVLPFQSNSVQLSSGISSPSHGNISIQINPEKTVFVDKAETVESLLEGSNFTFLSRLYGTLLLREPDPEGFKNYLSELERGVSREDVVLSVSTSPEAQKIGARLQGLTELSLDRSMQKGEDSANVDLASTRNVQSTSAVASNSNAQNSGEPVPTHSEIFVVPAAESLNLLLQGDNLEFLNCLYSTLLHRAPDEVGLNSYLSQLQNGADRLAIVLDVASSAEGRAMHVRLSGLDELLASRNARRRTGIFTWLSR
jgi:GT2 family glycosyltransferase